MKIIVGGGISGLAFAFYNHDSVVIEKETKKYNSPFVFIQCNEYTTRLLKDLDILKKVSCDKVKIVPTTTEEILNNKIKTNERSYLGTDRVSNIGENLSLSVYNISELELCRIIKEKIKERVIIGEVKNIYQDSIVVDNSTFHYDKLISTIHFKEFCKICKFWNYGEDIKTMSMFAEIFDIETSDNCIQYSNKDFPQASKVVFNSITKQLGIEYKERINDKTIVIPDARFHGKIPASPKNIIFLGRFATANPHWRIEDSLFVAQEGLLFIEMLDEQKRFDEAVKSITNIRGEDRIQKLILAAHSELNELLRETNYKMISKEKRKIKASSILEEGIDIMKLVLSILHEFEYTPREIKEMFYQKSKQVWDNLLNERFGGI